MKKIEDISRANGINSMRDLEATILTRKLAAGMLAASLNTSMSQLSDEQKAKAQYALRILSGMLATEMRYKDMEPFMQNATNIESLVLELAQNSYLQARTATDMLLLEYLKNS